MTSEPDNSCWIYNVTAKVYIRTKDKKTLFSDNGHPSNYCICVPEADQVKTVQVASFYRQYFLRKNSVRCGNCRYKKLR